MKATGEFGDYQEGRREVVTGGPLHLSLPPTVRRSSTLKLSLPSPSLPIPARPGPGEHADGRTGRRWPARVCGGGVIHLPCTTSINKSDNNNNDTSAKGLVSRHRIGKEGRFENWLIDRLRSVSYGQGKSPEKALFAIKLFHFSVTSAHLDRGRRIFTSLQRILDLYPRNDEQDARDQTPEY